MNQPRRHRTLALAVLGTVLLMGLDLSRPESTSFLRTGAAAALGPLERVLTVDRDDEFARLTRQRDELLRRRADDSADLRQARQVTSILVSPGARNAKLMAARVVAFNLAPTSDQRRVTIDVGVRDGVTKDLTVIAGAGLVGRVVSVAEWTSDVMVVGDRDLVAGVRVGASGRLGSVSAKVPVGGTPRGSEPLSLTLLEPGKIAVGDKVRTLGSVGGRPFLPDIALGTVVSVDPDRGQLTPTAVVEPDVDSATLDVVAVLLSAGRAVPRAPATGRAR